jgi:FtsH-binding integral membrane protein
MLSRGQQELRFGWMVAFFIGLIVIAAREEPPLSQVNLMLKGFGSLFLSTVLLSTLMAMWNERRGQIAPFRSDPINESFYW